MTTVPLPLICLTCLPPWPQAMMYAGKNLENRGASVAARLAPFVGQNVGISQSKTWKSDALVESFAWMNGRELLRDEDVFDQMQWALFNTDETAGKLLLVAHLVRVAKPSEYGRNPWHVAGQHGLVLSNVRQIEPVPCRGAVGAWKPYWCASCGAISAAGKSMQCAHCRAGNAYREDGERPALRECQ